MTGPHSQREKLFSDAIIDSLPGIFYLFDTEGRFLRWNRNMEQVTGYSADEMTRLHPLDLFRGDDRIRVGERIQEVFAAGQSSVTADFVAKNGTATAYFFTGVRALLDGVPHLVGVGIDISDRVRAEAALRTSEERYRRFFMEDLSADFIASADGKLVECNPSYVRIFGFESADEATSVNVTDLFPTPQHRSRLLARLRSEGPLYSHPLELRRRDGTSVHVVANVLPTLDEQGNLVSTRGYLFDVTEQRHLEAQLRHAQKMEAVGNLAGGVAHDFNNLLQAMLGQVQLLALDSELDESAAAVAGELEKLVRRGADLTRQLLLFSRRQTTKPETFDLNAVLNDSHELLRRLTRANIGLAIATADEPLWVEADRAQIGQILMNLVINAADAMPDGGEINVSTGAGPGQQALLEVTDTGEGIPDDIRDRIFEPFFTTKEKDKGTGLGLSVVHGIVARHHGTIDVDSSPDGGTTFRVLLPLVAVPASEKQRPVSAAGSLPGGNSERVLVVEDEEHARHTFENILKRLGYTVVAVGSGEEAGLLPNEEPFDLLLTDLMLPGISGREVATGLVDRWPDLKVIIMSGYAGDEDFRRRVATGEILFLQKPFLVETLAHTVRSALDER